MESDQRSDAGGDDKGHGDGDEADFRHQPWPWLSRSERQRNDRTNDSTISTTTSSRARRFRDGAGFPVHVSASLSGAPQPAAPAEYVGEHRRQDQQADDRACRRPRR